MNSSFRMAVLTSSIAFIAAQMDGKVDPAALTPERTLSVRLYDEAQVSPRVLRRATEEAARLFKTAGIRISWEQKYVEAPEDRGIDMTSGELRQLDERPYLVVRLTRGTPPAMLTGALGFALPFARQGAHVSIFYDRVENLAIAPTTESYVVLGHTIAHEIGHVLLRSSAHSTGGLMQARWNAATWRLASAGLLAFRREEAEGMCAGLPGGGRSIDQLRSFAMSAR